MAFDDRLAERVRERLREREGLSEKKMFGGLAFLLNGNMCCGVHDRDLIVRLDPNSMDLALAQPHTRVFDLTGRPFKGWIVVEAVGLDDGKALAEWVRIAVDYASSLPGK
jgi:hypothetical protein